MADTTLQPGQVRFIQHRLPGFESGEYQIIVNHALSAPDGGQTFSTTTQFYVAGERFQLNPTDVDSTFPPSHAQGEFLNVLPHLVFSRPSLPWIRSPQLAPAAPVDGADVPSWLALLVFDQDDPQPVLTATTVSGLVTPGDGVVSYPLADGLEFGQSINDPCAALDIDYGLFLSIAPSLQDLKWLASVRVVSGQKPSADPDAPPGGEYSVLMANRLPKAGKKSTVHLVSLEGLENHLPGGAESTGASAPKTIRLASLYQWSFDTQLEPQTFTDVIQQLQPWLSFSLPIRADAAPGPIVAAAMAMGYVGLDHRLRDGGRTASWYRGPLAPYQVPRTLAAQCPLGSADAALRFDPATGLLDASYAAAWQLGRLLGLQDQIFADRLFRWKHATSRAAVAAAEHDILDAALGIDTTPQLSGAPRAAALGDAVGAMMKVAVSALLGSPPPAPSPVAFIATSLGATPSNAPPPEVVAWLERLRGLHGVPFNYLVPQEAMLPPESIRFFHLDPNWIDALVDGAVSLGDAVTGDLSQAGDSPVGPSAGAPPLTASGFLLRSRAVKIWPGMEVNARAADNSPLTVVRYERLSDDVLFCLCQGVIAGLDLHEPPEAMHFGFDIDETAPAADPAGIDLRRLFKNLRNPVTGAAAPVGTQSATIPSPLPWRSPGAALDMSALASSASGALAPAAFTSAEFALIMVEGVDMVTFGQVAPPSSTS
ncbi:hypothetical protein ASD21_18160 [Caulobacter sp. Root1455]|uniref:hypothetical protein n=1 Tax=Caulobacter sp. Root1455 TaxID=1736465 RepID=UPI0006F6D092|nr:hypothetical protein [Caulobacter sp. Root1455]KQZ05909.1 hypothetical protein ASD21_18160 [Caulobacter sp. Root1455]